MPGILIDCLRKYQRLSQTPLESTRAPVHFLMLGGAGQAVPTIDAYEIVFLERICAIEDYFNVQISLRGEITDNEYNTVVYISDLIRNDLVIGTWSEVTFTGSLSQHFREKLTTLDKELYMFSFVGVGHIDLFGVEIEFRFMRTFKYAIMVDIDKVRRKAEVLDDGDSIKITFRAGDDKTVIDTLKIPEHFDSAS